MKIYSSRELERLESDLSQLQKTKRNELLNAGYSPDEALYLIGVRNDTVPSYLTDKQQIIIRKHLRKTKNGRKTSVRKHKRRKPRRRIRMNKKVSFITADGRKVSFSPKKKSKTKRKAKFKKGSKEAKAFMAKLRKMK